MDNKTTGNVEEFDPFRVRPLPDQPRKRFKGIAELAASIKEIGQASPGIVTRVTDDPDFDVQLIDGERRLRACRNLGCKFRAEVKAEPADAAETFVASFAANFGRQDHDCVEIAEGLQRMKDAGKTVEQLASISGHSTAWVYQHLGFNTLHPEVKNMLIPPPNDERSPISFQIAQLLVPLPQPRQLYIAKRIVKHDYSYPAVRRMVVAERREAGEPESTILGMGPKRSLTKVESIVEDGSNRIGIFLDMPGVELNRLIDDLDNSTKRQLVKLISDYMDDLDGLGNAIEARIPKVVSRSN